MRINNNMPDINKNLLETILPVSDRKIEYQLLLHPSSSVSEHDQLQLNIQLIENIQLRHLIKQFEDVLNKVKHLELNYLLQPVQIATFKLKELQKITEALSCDYYEDYPCANKNCSKELYISKIINNEKRPSSNNAADDSCECYNVRCEKSCHSSSNGAELDENEKMITLIQKAANNHSEKKTSSGTKCNPCKCSFDASGKKVKTLECRLASKARKFKRNEAEMREFNNVVKLKRDETKLLPTSRMSATNILSERRISNSKLEIQTNLTNFKLNVKKENTAIQDITYQNLPLERNKAIYCNLSSESSSEEYYSDSSNDQIDLTKSTALPGPSRFYSEESKNKKIHPHVETIKVGESATCPCGCGDVETLSEGKYVNRSPSKCDNCGVEMAEMLSKRKKLRIRKPSDASENESAIKKQDICLLALSRL